MRRDAPGSRAEPAAAPAAPAAAAAAAGRSVLPEAGAPGRQGEGQRHPGQVGLPRREGTQPPTVVRKTEARSEYLHIARPLHVRLPSHQWWHAKWKLSRNMHTLHTRFCTFGSDLLAQSVLIKKKSFCIGSSVGSLLRVRCWLGSFFCCCFAVASMDALEGKWDGLLERGGWREGVERNASCESKGL